MRHARPDYERFQDPEGKIPEDEPVFLIRGQDLAAPGTLRAWAEIASGYGAETVFCDRIRKFAVEMEDWQLAHGGKVPDMPS